MAKIVIFYFSGTGNSMAAALKLAALLPDAEAAPMLGCDPVALAGGEASVIGLVYPIHMNAVPRTVADFIGRLGPVKGRRVFAVATHGGFPFLAGLHLEKVLKRNKTALDAYYEIQMINNTPKGVAPKPLMRLDWELGITDDIVDRALKAADAGIEEIAEEIAKGASRPVPRPSSFKGKAARLGMALLWTVSANSRPTLDFINDVGCTGCGICEKVCTTGRIKLRNGKPSWNGPDCNYCYACFNYCPAQSIGVKHYTKKLGRYHHPEISAADIAAQKSK